MAKEPDNTSGAGRHAGALNARELFLAAHRELELAARDAVVALGRSIDDSTDDLSAAVRRAWTSYGEAEAAQRAAVREQTSGATGDAAGSEPAVPAKEATTATSAYESYREAIIVARRRATRDAEDAQTKCASAIDAARRVAMDAVRAAYVTYLERVAAAFEGAVDLDPAALDAVGRSISSGAALAQRALNAAEN